MSSFIKLNRDFFSTEHWKEKRVFSKAEAYIDLLRIAPYREENGLRKGEFKLPRREMESRWLWSGTKISNFLKELNEKDAIFVKNSEKTVTYSFIRYDDYGNEAKPKEKVIENFTDIEDISEFLNTFHKNKKYMLIAHSFWKLWRKYNENNTTYKNAKIEKWYKDVELLIERDGQKIERLIAILKFFEKCAKEEAGYDTFWFETIKSVGAFRKVDKEEVYYIDKISDIVNKKLQSSEDFLRLVKTSVKKFNELEL